MMRLVSSRGWLDAGRSSTSAPGPTLLARAYSVRPSQLVP